MRIYTEVVIDIASGEVDQESSYEYSGPVALCKGDNEVKETAEEKELAKISQEQWNSYQDRFAPLEDEFIANIEQDASDHAAMAGQVNASVGSAYDKFGDTVKSNQFAAGMDPSSGRYRAAISGLNMDRGTSAAKATTDASQAVDDQTIIGLQNAVSMGRGEAMTAARDMTTLAGDATSGAINDAYSDQQKSNSIGSSVASVAGMGLAGWNNNNKKADE